MFGLGNSKEFVQKLQARYRLDTQRASLINLVHNNFRGSSVMKQINIHAAKTNLSALVGRAAANEPLS